MGKTGQAAVKKDAAATVGQPSGYAIERDGGETRPLDAATVRALLEGWRVKREIEALEGTLKEINARLIEGFGDGMTLVVPHVVRATVTRRATLKVADPERLKSVLGGRFDDLVRESTSYKPEERLVEMVSDGDDPLVPSIRACLAVAESTSVTWRAEK